MNTRKQRTVLITGITGGFGRALADEFASHDFSIIGVSRSKPDFPVTLHIQADLSDPEQRNRIASQVSHLAFGLDVLINNAGIGLYDTWESMNEQELRHLMEVNFFAPVALTHSLLPLLKLAEGTIINISSVAGILPVPVMGAYCASKYAVNAFSDTLRAELADTRTHVLNMIVGRINTGFSTRAMGSKKPPQTPFSGSAEGLAAATFKACIDRKRQRIYPGWYRLIPVIQRTFPKFYDRLSMRKWQS